MLFAIVQADNEDLMDGGPCYFYKASGAIRFDIDLYFEGKDYLKVTSKNKEGIETKGNLSFTGGTGDYEIIAAFKTDRDIQTLLYSSENLHTDSYKIYTGGAIDGDETNGLYTKINSYSGGEVITTSNVESGKFERQNENISNMLLKALLIEIGALLVFVSAIFISSKMKKRVTK